MTAEGRARWTEEEKDFIRANYQRMTDEQLAEALRTRSADAVRFMRAKLDCVRHWKREPVKRFTSGSRGCLIGKCRIWTVSPCCTDCAKRGSCRDVCHNDPSCCGLTTDETGVPV